MKKYKALLDSFINGHMTASEFEQQYMNLFKKDEAIDPTSEEFKILDNLFVYCDMYYADPTLKDEGDIDETQLLTAAKEANEALKSL